MANEVPSNRVSVMSRPKMNQMNSPSRVPVSSLKCRASAGRFRVAGAKITPATKAATNPLPPQTLASP